MFVTLAIVIFFTSMIMSGCTDSPKHFGIGVVLSVTTLLADVYKIEFTGEAKVEKHQIYYVDKIPVIRSKHDKLIDIQKFFRVPLKETDIIIEEYKVFFDGTTGNIRYKLEERAEND